MKSLKYLVIHCTDTPEGREISADDIRRWHLKERGWRQVGYTDMIHLDGRVERLVENNDDAYVDGWEITNGVRGQNSVSRHVVYVGGKDRKNITVTDTRTAAQKKALADYCRKVKETVPGVKIVGHRDLDKNKACPSFDVKSWLKSEGI